MDPQVAMELTGVSLEFGARKILDGISVEIRRGEIFGWFGVNGAGKSSLIRVITGQIRPSSGEVLICGHSVVRDPRAAKAKLGFVPAESVAPEVLTPRDLLGALAVLHACPSEQVQAVLERFGLSGIAERRIAKAGEEERRRISLAAALLHQPEVLIAAEPFLGIDLGEIIAMRALMRELAARGTAVVFTARSLEVIEKVCDRIAFLHQGRMLACGTGRELCALAGATDLEEALLILRKADEAAQRGAA